MMHSQTATIAISKPRRTIDMTTTFFLVLATVVFIAAFYSAVVHPMAASDEAITFTGP